MQILEQQCQRHQSQPAVSSGEQRLSWSMNIDDAMNNDDSVSSPPSPSPDNEERHAVNNQQRPRRRRSTFMRLLMSPQPRTQNNNVNRSLSAPTTSLEQNVRRITLEEVEQQHDKFDLPASTYTFFITEPVFSMPFFVALITYGVVNIFYYSCNFLLPFSCSCMKEAHSYISLLLCSASPALV